MKKSLVISLLLACCALGSPNRVAASPGGPTSPRWTSFHDPNLGVSAVFPQNIFNVDAGSPPAGRGRQYATSDGRALVAFFTLPNGEASKPGDYLSRMGVPKNAKLSYSRVTRRFFAISGISGNRIFYNRCNTIGYSGSMRCVHLEYPSAEKRSWDKIVTRISLSLHG
ncbi:MAG: hypothetical protein JOY67_09360 [Hyphomicrobiales bacterium]|nr:hypothetical protein [Hyphomicrobiales bacterium]MBV9113017.1 hypothetical protein [Hyphomicrobiales bacterium]MBV9517566.1 hypothetical protein [Hyphomicrobiales bacterium]